MTSRSLATSPSVSGGQATRRCRHAAIPAHLPPPCGSCRRSPTRRSRRSCRLPHRRCRARSVASWADGGRRRARPTVPRARPPSAGRSGSCPPPSSRRLRPAARGHCDLSARRATWGTGRHGTGAATRSRSGGRWTTAGLVQCADRSDRAGAGTPAGRSVARASSDGSSFTDERWHAMAEGLPYADGRCLLAYDEQGDAVPVVTMWPAGPGPGGATNGVRGSASTSSTRSPLAASPSTCSASRTPSLVAME
jgi:hypothetical protein